MHHIVNECRVLWKTGRRLQIIPARLPRDHMPILLNLRYTLQPQRTEAETQSGSKWACKRLQTVCRGVTNDTLGRPHEGTCQNILQPTPHIQRDDAQTRLSALRCKLFSEQATRREQMGVARAPGRLLGTSPARTAQAHDFELAIASMDENVRSSSKHFAGTGAA